VRGEAYTEFRYGNLRERNHLRNPGVDGREEVGCGGIGWIKLAQDWDRWWALVNVVMNVQVP
jgi:hypothetical protein